MAPSGPDFPPGNYVSVGGERLDRRHATFRLTGDLLDPDQITAATGLEPTSSHRAGDPRKATERSPTPSAYRSGLWALDSEATLARHEGTLDDHLNVLLGLLEPVAREVHDSMDDQSLSADFFCGYFLGQWNSSFRISSAIASRIGALGAQLLFDLYSYDETDDDLARLTDWPASKLHDASLEDVEVQWGSGTARLHLIPHSVYADKPHIIVAKGLQGVSIPHQQPWGPTGQILEAPEPTPSEGALRLQVTMQSGDEIEILATSFWRNRPLA